MLKRLSIVGGGSMGPLLTAFSVRLLDIPCRYGFHVLVAARLGVVEAGTFYMVFSIVTLAAGLGRLGLDRAVTREVAGALVHGSSARARAAIAQGCRTVFLLSAAVALLNAACAGPIARHALDRPELALPLAIGGLSILPLGLSVAAAGALAGLQRVGLSQMIYSWLWPALFCIPALFVPLTLEGALVLLLAATTGNAMVGLVLLWRHLPARAASRVPLGRVPLLRPGLSLFSSEIFQLTASSAPVLVLGFLAGDRAAGLFALAWRLALVLNLLVSAVGAMASPRFASLHVAGDSAGLARLHSNVVALVIGLGSMPVLILLFAAGPLLELVGPGYGAGASALRILLIGQVAAMACAGAPELLGMTGMLGSLRKLNGLSVMVLLASLALLVPALAEKGGAAAVSLALSLNAAGSALLVRRHLGICVLRLRAPS